MNIKLAIGIRRLAAFSVDWVVVIFWGGLMFATVMMITNGDPPQPANPWIGQGIGLLTMTIPVTLYFSIFESSKKRASLGKRALGLHVVHETGKRLSLRSAFVRNVFKFLPWEVGHMVAHQAAHSGDGRIPAWVWGATAVAFLGPLWWIIEIFKEGSTPYDRWASARVARKYDDGTPSATISQYFQHQAD